MPLVASALIAANRCRMNSDRNDIAYSLGAGFSTQAEFADRPRRPDAIVVG